MKASMTCDYRQFKAALNASLAVTAAEPFDVVRLYPQPELCRLGIAAANLHSVFISWIDLEMMTDRTRDIEVAEISAQEAKAHKFRYCVGGGHCQPAFPDRYRGAGGVGVPHPLPDVCWLDGCPRLDQAVF